MVYARSIVVGGVVDLEACSSVGRGSIGIRGQNEWSMVLATNSKVCRGQGSNRVPIPGCQRRWYGNVIYGLRPTEFSIRAQEERISGGCLRWRECDGILAQPAPVIEGG